MPTAYSGKVFSFDHNWTTPVVERLSWLTSVLRKRDGSEQRIRLRQQPRRSFDYLALIGGEDELDQRRRFDALLFNNQDQEIMVPFWPDAWATDRAYSIGATTIVLGLDYDPTARDIDNEESYMMFWRGYNDYEVVQCSHTTPLTYNVAGIGSPTTWGWNLHVQTALTKNWPAGTIVMPARKCLFDPSTSGNVFASDIQELTVKFRVKTPTTAPVTSYRATAPTADTYRSTDVLPDPGMDGSNTRQLERQLAVVDFNVGQFSYDSIQTAPFGGIDININVSGRDELTTFLGWLNIRRGRQKAFWLPTWEKDFYNVLLDPDNADRFFADSFGYTANYGGIEPRIDVAFINADRSMEYRRIIGSSDDDTTETFTVDSDLPDPLTPERTSFLRYCRLDQDEIELSWVTSDDVTTSLKGRELIKTV